MPLIALPVFAETILPKIGHTGVVPLQFHQPVNLSSALVAQAR
jgi:hypothetical protein